MQFLKLIGKITAVVAILPVLVTSTPVEAGKKMKGSVRVDGSSTVYPVTEATAEEFRSVQPKVRVTVGLSGTGGGFKRFTKGETDISDASRPIKDKEFQLCRQHKVDFIEIPVAYDGLSIVIHPDNDFAETLTIDQLKKIGRVNPHTTKRPLMAARFPV